MSANLRKLFDRPEVRVMLALLGLLAIAVASIAISSLPGMPTIAEAIDNSMMMTFFFMAFVVLLACGHLIGRALNLIGGTVLLGFGLTVLALAVVLVLGLTLIIGALLAILFMVFGIIFLFILFYMGWSQFMSIARAAMSLHYHANNQTE